MPDEQGIEAIAVAQGTLLYLSPLPRVLVHRQGCMILSNFENCHVHYNMHVESIDIPSDQVETVEESLHIWDSTLLEEIQDYADPSQLVLQPPLQAVEKWVEKWVE